MAGETNAFLRDPDQAARREELRAFIGPNAERFLKTYDGLQARAVRAKGEKPAFRQHLGFVSLAFLLGPCWFFYRKLWWWAGGVSAAMVLLAFIPLPTNQIGLPFGIACAMAGQTAYLNHAMTQIARIRGGAARADPAALREAGGVSTVAGWVSGLVVGLLVAAAIFAAVRAMRSGGASLLDG
jgi:hypothetical protein